MESEQALSPGQRKRRRQKERMARDPVYREHICMRRREREKRRNPGYLQRRAERQRARRQTPEYRARIRARQTPEYRAKLRQRYLERNALAIVERNRRRLIKRREKEMRSAAHRLKIEQSRQRLLELHAERQRRKQARLQQPSLGKLPGSVRRRLDPQFRDRELVRERRRRANHRAVIAAFDELGLIPEARPVTPLPPRTKQAPTFVWMPIWWPPHQPRRWAGDLPEFVREVHGYYYFSPPRWACMRHEALGTDRAEACRRVETVLLPELNQRRKRASWRKRRIIVRKPKDRPPPWSSRKKIYRTRNREKERHERACINALRELGWLDGYQVITEPAP